jgi:dihydrofolate reductase
MKTQYFCASSLDGFIADQNNSLDWLLQFGDGTGEFYSSFIAQVGAIAMGSITYDWVLDNDTLKDPANPKPWPYKQTCWVFTNRSLRTLPDADVRCVKGDVKPVYDEMRKVAADKNIWLAGGGGLVGQFYDAGLLDELIIGIAPVLLGSGAPLLPRRISKPPLKLISVEQFKDGMVQMHYELVR